MGVWTLGWAQHQEIGDPLAKLVLICLGDALYEETGLCFPSHGYLAYLANCSTDCVKRKLRFLEKEGWITRTARHTAKGRQTSNTYKINMDRGITQDQWRERLKERFGRGDSSTPPSPGGVTPALERGASKPLRRGTQSPPRTKGEGNKSASRISNFSSGRPGCDRPADPPSEERRRVGDLMAGLVRKMDVSKRKFSN